MRIEGYDYSTPGAYFVTVCTADRKPIFWLERRGGYHPPEKNRFLFNVCREADSLPYNLPTTPTISTTKMTTNRRGGYYPPEKNRFLLNSRRAHYVKQKNNSCLKVLERMGVRGKEKFFQEFFLPPHKNR